MSPDISISSNIYFGRSVYSCLFSLRVFLAWLCPTNIQGLHSIHQAGDINCSWQCLCEGLPSIASKTFTDVHIEGLTFACNTSLKTQMVLIYTFTWLYFYPCSISFFNYCSLSLSLSTVYDVVFSHIDKISMINSLNRLSLLFQRIS